MAENEYASPLAGLAATVESHDRSVSATLRHGGRLELRIHPLAYRRYQEDTLNSLLGVLLTDAWSEYRRRYFEFVSDAMGVTVRENEHEGGARLRAYRSEWQALPAQGVSPDHRIQIRSEGLARWQVRVRQGTLRSLSQDDFVSEFGKAFEALMREHNEKLAALRDEHFGRS